MLATLAGTLGESVYNQRVTRASPDFCEEVGDTMSHNVNFNALPSIVRKIGQDIGCTKPSIRLGMEA